MAGFSSMDDFVNQVTVNGKFWRADFNKNTFGTTAHTVGMWYCLFRGGGNPGADSIFGTGTNLAFQALTDATTNATGIQHGGNVGGGTGWKQILNSSAFSAAPTTMPAVFMLVDMLGFYNITSVTTTGAQTLNNTVTLPRYTDGAGVQAFITPSTVMGAATPNITLGYTNSGNTASRATPSSPALPSGLTAAPVTSIVYSGTGAGKFGPFVPLQGGDAGIRSVQSINLSASYVSGVLNLVLCKPLLTLPMTSQGIAAERDMLSQIPSLPRVYDGACLAWLMYAGAATPVNSAFYGHIDFGWS
jgi:hypothetical protein